jgi:polyisoprenoid-binding protein YceI
MTLFVLAVAAAGCTSSCAPGEDLEKENRPGVKTNAHSADESGNAENTIPSGNYRINSGQSRLVAGVLVGGMFKKLGHDHAISIRGMAGEVELPSGSTGEGTLRLTLKAASAAEIGKEFSHKDRQKINKSVRDEALMVDRYPEITFKSTRISPREAGGEARRVKVEGELTLHGVTRPIVFAAQLTVRGTSLHAHSEFTILHSDFQIKRLSAAGGTIKAKDPIHISCDIVAEKE